MENLIKNKKIIFICIICIIIVFVIVLLSNDKKLVIEEGNTEDFVYLKNYEVNEYVPIYVTQDDIVKKYLNEYKNNLIYNIDKAYNTLNKEYREKKFSNLDDYKNYVNSNLSLSTFSMEVDKYSVTKIGGQKLFDIYDKSGNRYLIKEISIMNYEVYLDEYTVDIYY